MVSTSADAGPLSIGPQVGNAVPPPPTSASPPPAPLGVAATPETLPPAPLPERSAIRATTGATDIASPLARVAAANAAARVQPSRFGYLNAI